MIASKFSQLDALMNMPLTEKIAYAEEVCRKQVDDKTVVACSFGKDSMLALWFARKVKSDVKVLYNDTGVEYPEVRRFAEEVRKSWDLNLEILKPETTFWNLKAKYGWPHKRVEYNRGVRKGKSTPKCCIYLKEKPMQKWVNEHPEIEKIILGLTAEESRQRKILFARYGSSCYFDNTRYVHPILKVNPIMPWRATDVWRFTRKNKIPICPSYAKYDLQRLGCWPCTGYTNWQKNLRRFSPKIYEIAMREKEGQTLLT